MKKLFSVLTVICLLVFLFGCQPKMGQAGKIKSYGATGFFPDKASARPLVKDTVPRNAAFENRKAEKFPYAITPELLRRGQERFAIYCSVCHGLDGNADGVAVQRGFPAPPSYNIDRLRKVSVSYFYDVITDGHGRMLSYSDRVPVSDRWAIAAYVRTLQFSQDADVKGKGASP